MDIEDVVRRILVAYWPLIVLLVGIGIAAPGAYHLNDETTYTASVRFVIDAPDPHAVNESTAVADTARSIVTSPSHVAVALTTAGVTKDPVRFASRNIELQPLGSSGVLVLNVKDTNPRAAAAIANLLAADAIATRIEISRSQAQSMVAALTAQISDLDARIAALDAQTANFRAIPVDELNGLYAERATLAQERLTLESERLQMSSSLALRPQGGVVDAADAPTVPDASRAPVDMALGGLGGLVLGVLVAALLATFRPRISGKRSLQAALSAPVLGDASESEAVGGAKLTTKIQLAAQRAGVTRLQLAPLGRGEQSDAVTRLLAERLSLDTGLAGSTAPGDGQARKGNDKPLVVKRLDLSSPSKNGDFAHTGLLLVVPTTLDKKALASGADLVELTGWPVAGIVTYEEDQGDRSAWKAPVAYVSRRLPWRSR